MWNDEEIGEVRAVEHVGSVFRRAFLHADFGPQFPLRAGTAARYHVHGTEVPSHRNSGNLPEQRQLCPMHSTQFLE
jgi:hypothetical protein